MKDKPLPIHGRGAANNPPNRFEPLHTVRDIEACETAQALPRTRLFGDKSHSIISKNESPDVGFDSSINPYRGCEHGCVYCYARPTHEYLGFSAGLDFETTILVKESAPVLLKQELSSPGWRPQVLAISGVTDPYQPVERQLQLTRSCLEVLVNFRNPVVIVTKNHLVTRDLDLLTELTRYQAAAVFISITTLDNDLARRMEPRASQPELRFQAIHSLSQAGVPTGVMVAPVIPGLTDHELPSIVEKAKLAGAQSASYVMLRLPFAVKHLFEDWLTTHFPERKEKILNRIRAIRGGQLNDPQFKTRMKGEGIFAEQIASLFAAACRKAGISNARPTLSTSSFRRIQENQLQLFP